MKKTPKEKHKYIFPNFLASAMKNTDMPTQLRSAMMSIFMLLIGMILMGVYSLVYLQQGLYFKALIIFNLVAGFIFMTSYLVTSYQQYVSYMDAMELQTLNLNPNMANLNPEANIPKNRINQLLFFGGLLLMLSSVLVFFLVSKSDARNYIVAILFILGIIFTMSVFFRKNKKKKREKKIEELTKSIKLQEDELEQQRQIEREDLGIIEEPESGEYQDPNQEYNQEYPDYKSKIVYFK